ncbi:hypothetical protein MPLA_340051 [Mesorhizobium sp. ORS 3359]|nr:hypothetical protein MPLA_340051 [Mesorhizobium sp. ORS 3359]
MVRRTLRLERLFNAAPFVSVKPTTLNSILSE